MSWAAEKAREIAGHWSSDDFSGDVTDPLVLRAIIETIEHCAKVVEDQDYVSSGPMDEELAAKAAAMAIRKLGEP